MAPINDILVYYAFEGGLRSSVISSWVRRKTGTETVNGDAAESFRDQSVVKEELVLFYGGDVSHLFIQTHLEILLLYIVGLL